MKTAADLVNALVRDQDLYGGFWVERLSAILAAGKREGAEEMRERCASMALKCSKSLWVKSNMLALPLPGDVEAELRQG